MEQQAHAVEVALAGFQESLKPMASTSSRTLNAQLPAVDKAVTHLCLARAAVALFELYLRTSGTSTEGHSIQKEKARIQAYAQKVEKAASAQWLSDHRPTTSVNIAAANRFISHAIPELTSDQKTALREAGASARQTSRKEDSEPAGHRSAADAAEEFLDSLQGPQKLMEKPRKSKRQKAQ